MANPTAENSLAAKRLCVRPELMTARYDLIVLGAGNAGQVAARMARRAGQSVLVVEARDVGGTCPLRGCVPKKVLVAAAESLENVRRAGAHHIEAGPAKLDWKKLIERKQTFVDGVPESMEKGLRKQGIDVVHGTARFTGRTRIEVAGETCEFSKAVISTGARPRKLPIPGFEHALTSDDLLELRKQPRSLVFIGGGVIAMEFTHVLARAGTKVTILEVASRPLAAMDKDLVGGLQDETEKLGVEFFTEARVQSIDNNGQGFSVAFEHRGEQKTLDADAVANGAGRAAALDELNLEAASIERHDAGIVVDEYLRSVSNPDVFVAGDAIGKPRQLSAVASYEGKIVGHNLTNEDQKKPDYRSIPDVVFTVPALAGVGLSEEEAREQGLKFRTSLSNMKEWRSAKTYAEPVSLAKVLVEEGSEKILGARILGHGAEEIIHSFAFAIKFGLTAKDLKDFVYAYPTNTSDIRFLL